MEKPKQRRNRQKVQKYGSYLVDLFETWKIIIIIYKQNFWA
jgi:hypothetical protein